MSSPGQQPPKQRRPFSPGMILLLLVALWAWPRSPDQPEAGPLRQRRFLMDTLVTITAYPPAGEADGHAVLDQAFAEISRIEDLFTSYRESPIWSWNQSGVLARAEAPPELLAALERVRFLHEQSLGSFDPTLGRVKELWGFGRETSDSPRPPSPEALGEALSHSGMGLLVEGPERLELKDGMHLDLGGYAKGLAVDRATAVLASRGFAALVDAGGDMACTGAKPDGSPWRIGVRDPAHPDGVLGILELRSGAVATSGNYERFFLFEGVRYHHLLDPATGRPANHFVQSTVRADSCAEADAWATAYFVAPRSAQDALIQAGAPPALLLTSDDKRLTVGQFPPLEDPAR